MQNQIHHYRIEFYGGPNDGAMQFLKDKPKENYEIVSKVKNDITNENEIYVYKYVLTWLNSQQAKYIYQDYHIIKG